MIEKQAQFKVSGMKCEGCITRARDALAQVPGIIAAEFDLGSGRAVVTGQIDPETVCAALSRAGYPTIRDDNASP